ncbi:hypothetical protein HYC85_012233 [Camellia sinensis]|uniref:DUF4283 domain-containing protein n=1 Tax=Camellia sinensis TaxID=4442 RepID=A0A7J7HBD1_CAMSI|nr:hypothetical protein HYC85_012233 [Camellia sinensis]
MKCCLTERSLLITTTRPQVIVLTLEGSLTRPSLSIDRDCHQRRVQRERAMRVLQLVRVLSRASLSRLQEWGSNFVSASKEAKSVRPTGTRWSQHTRTLSSSSASSSLSTKTALTTLAKELGLEAQIVTVGLKGKKPLRERDSENPPPPPVSPLLLPPVQLPPFAQPSPPPQAAHFFGRQTAPSQPRFQQFAQTSEQPPPSPPPTPLQTQPPPPPPPLRTPQPPPLSPPSPPLQTPQPPPLASPPSPPLQTPQPPPLSPPPPQAQASFPESTYVWADRYRPEALKDFICNRDKALELKALAKKEDCGHFIFEGSPGVGKKTMIWALLRESYGEDKVQTKEELKKFVLKGEVVSSIKVSVKISPQHVEVNLSEVKGYEKHVIVELMQETINRLAKKALQCNKDNCRVIILYEADKLSADALLYIKWQLGKHKGCSKVFFCCSDASKLQPIMSLCTVVKLLPPSNEEIVEVLEFIAKQEGIELPHQLADKIAINAKNNLRQAIRSLEATWQANSALTEDQEIMIGWEGDIANIAKNIVEEQSPKHSIGWEISLMKSPNKQALVRELKKCSADEFQEQIDSLYDEYKKTARKRDEDSLKRHKDPVKKNLHHFMRIEAHITKQKICHYEMAKPSDGGWQPVVRRHGRRGVWNSRMNVSIHSVFVDNLPETMRAIGLYTCSIAADMAIQKANGLWCDDKALKVKMADYGKEYGSKHKAGPSTQPRKFAAEPNRTHVGYQGKRSFAEVVSGKAAGPNTSCIIKASEEGNGWLYESVIARLKPLFIVEDFKKELERRDLEEVQVRAGGGRDLMLTFQSQEIMKDKLLLMKSWLNEWCDSVLEWKQGMSITQERLVWLSCYGVPLNLWSCNTFINIGKMWGIVTAVDEDTLNLNHFQYGKMQIATNFMALINQTLSLECKGVLYPVRVCKEQIIIIKDLQVPGLSNSSEEFSGGTRNSNLVKVGTQFAERGRKFEEGDDHVTMEAHDSSNIMAEDDQLRDASMVAESALQEGMSEANGYVCQESSARLLMSPKMRAVDEGGRTEIEIQNSGSIKTLCGPDNMGQGINLIADLNSAHECNGSDAAPILDNLVVGPSRIAPLTAVLVPINICSSILHTAPMILSVGALDHPQPKQTKGLCVTSSSPKCSSFQRKDTRRKLRVGPSSFRKATLNLRKGAVF